MQIGFRLYGQEGCPHCEEAAKFLLEQGVGIQLIGITGDPIATGGISRALGEPVPVPVLVSFATNEIVVGFRREEYARAVDVFKRHLSDSVGNPPPSERVGPSDPAREGQSVSPSSQTA